MKVLHIVANISIRSGIMSVLMSYYRNMDLNIFSFEFLYFDNRNNTYKGEIERLGGKVHKIERSCNPFKFAGSIREFLKSNITNYEIIHIHENYLVGSLIGAKSKIGTKKIIVHAHATRFSDHRLGEIRNRVLSIPNSFLSDYFFACSNTAGRAIFGNKFMRIGYVMNNAIDLSKFVANSDVRQKCRQDLGLADKYVIGHVGNFTAQKNHFFLIDIFYEIQKEKNNAVLVLVGDGIRKNAVLRKCTTLDIIDKVVYLGTRNDIDKIMNCFDCFLFPSIYEGLGIVLIEAQATGVPCVFSDVVPEEANILDEKNMILSLNERPRKWVNAVLDCERINGVIANEKVRQAGYDIKIEAKKLEKIYEGMIG